MALADSPHLGRLRQVAGRHLPVSPATRQALQERFGSLY
jgi:hypothetical protein